MSMNAPVAGRPHSSRDLVSAPGNTNLADLLERVLDKGAIIAGDIVLALGAVEFLTLKVRLLIASIDKARELGIDWWEHDAFVSSEARERELEGDTELLRNRLERLERRLLPPPQEADQEYAEAVQWSNTPPAYVLDQQGRVIAELKQPGQHAHEVEQPQAPQRASWPAEQPYGEAGVQAQMRIPSPTEQPHEEEQPHAPERAPQPEAAQAEQPAGAKPRVDPALHERIAQAMQPVLEELRQPNAQAPQPVKQARPEGWHEEEQEQPQAQQRASQPEAAPNPAPAPVLEEEGRMTAKPKRGRVAWHLAVVDLDREGKVIAELKQPGQQADEEEQKAAPTYILDKQGRVIAELTQPVEQAQEDEQPQAQQRAPWPVEQLHEEASLHAPERTPQPQVEQPAGAEPLMGQTLQERLAQAMRPVLEELPQRIAQAWQPAAQGRPARQPGEEQKEEQPQAPRPEAAQNPAPARVLEREGRVIAEVEQLAQPPEEEEGRQAQERAPQPGAAQAEQPAGAGPLLGQALHEHIAQAVRPVLEELRQRNAQARQPVEQAWPKG